MEAALAAVVGGKAGEWAAREHTARAHISGDLLARVNRGPSILEGRRPTKGCPTV